MSCVTLPQRANLTLDLRHAQRKQQEQDFYTSSPGVGSNGNLSPNLQPPTPPTYPVNREPASIRKIGNKYILLEHLESSSLQRCIAIETQEEFVCKVVPNDRYRETLAGHLRLDQHPHVNSVEEMLIGSSNTYIFFPRCYGDLHSYVRQKRNLREAEAVGLFRQVVLAVTACHEAGVVLRDLKLRKFVFKDPQKTQLKLETLDDAVILDKDDDWLNDRHGCPAYVSPEILTTASNYSGKAADCWSLGVMLYTMLIGRYPFHDTEPSGLFSKIRRGSYHVPEMLSPRARCLIKSLLRMDPSERLSAEDVLDHPWFKTCLRRNFSTVDTSSCGSSEDANVPDQTVPDMDSEEENSSLFV